MKKSNLGTEKSKPSLFDNDKEKNKKISNTIGNLLNKNNLIISLLLILVFHSFYLQFVVLDEIQKDAEMAYVGAAEAGYYAEMARDEAEKAYDEASDAAYQARRANSNSFGNQCWSCPN